jgi:hypothetical protein
MAENDPSWLREDTSWRKTTRHGEELLISRQQAKYESDYGIARRLNARVPFVPVGFCLRFRSSIFKSPFIYFRLDKKSYFGYWGTVPQYDSNTTFFFQEPAHG